MLFIFIIKMWKEITFSDFNGAAYDSPSLIVQQLAQANRKENSKAL